MNERRERDGWDKLQAAATILSPLVIAFVGGLFTYQWNRAESERTAAARQDELAIDRARVVKEFMPALSSEGDERRIALIALSKIGYPELAAGLAASKISESSLSALNTLASSGDAVESDAARDVLTRLFQQQRENFVQVLLGGKPNASGFLVAPDVVVTGNFAIPSRGSKQEVSVVLSDGKRVPAARSFRDDASGVGIIQLPQPAPTKGLSLLSRQPEAGAFVVVIGDQQGRGLTPIGGTVVAAHVKLRMGLETGEEMELPDALSVRFESDVVGVGGGPVLSADGEVVGLLHSRYFNGESSCVPASTIARAVEALLGRKL